MQRVRLNGTELENDVRGSGEPLLLIHGSILADAFSPLATAANIAKHYRVISYHRRGFAGSARAQAPFTIRQQAADAHALLRHLGLPRAHVAGHSYGAAIGLQLARDVPAAVHSLALLETPLLATVPSGPGFGEWIASVPLAMYQRGDKAGATDAFLTAVAGAEYRQLLSRFLPPGAVELAVADLDTFFQVELPALQAWQFTAQDAAQISQPVLAVVGADTAPAFQESHEVIKQWIPRAEEAVIPGATHALQYMNPGAVADALTRFLARHPL